MKMKGIVIGSVVAGLAFGAALPAAAAPSFEVETVCEIAFTELQGGEVASVPDDQQTSYFAPGQDARDYAVRKCTESRGNQTQSLACRRLITPWSNPVAFEATNFECQMISCDDPDLFVTADTQKLRVKVRGPSTVEVLLDCNRSRKR